MVGPPIPEEITVRPADPNELSAVLGVLDAVAVRPKRRAQGIGSALLEAAKRRRAELSVECEGSVVPFYRSVGFRIEALPDSERFRGAWSGAGEPASRPGSAE